MMERTTVRLPGELLARAKRKAAAEGRTLTSLIEDGLRAVVAEPHKKSLHTARVLPRVSTATGGLQPGIDLTKMSDYYEMEDAEYLERMKNYK